MRVGVAVLGGCVRGQDGRVGSKLTASAELFGRDGIEPIVLPPLSSGPICSSAVVAIHEAESDKGRVLLIGGYTGNQVTRSSAMQYIDLATGVCTSQPPLLTQRGTLADCTAARLHG